jgi:hypothetical protein
MREMWDVRAIFMVATVSMIYCSVFYANIIFVMASPWRK